PSLASGLLLHSLFDDFLGFRDLAQRQAEAPRVEEPDERNRNEAGEVEPDRVRQGLGSVRTEDVDQDKPRCTLEWAEEPGPRGNAACQCNGGLQEERGFERQMQPEPNAARVKRAC